MWVLLKAGFAINQSKIKGPAEEVHFLGLKWKDGHCHIPMDVVKNVTAMSPPANEKQTAAFLGIVDFWRMCALGCSQLVSPLLLSNLKEELFQVGPCSRPSNRSYRR